MKMFEEMLMNRRDLFRKSLRFSALGGLAVLGFFAMKRPGNSNCINQKLCRGCRILDRCALQEATAARRRQARQ